ncbi:MAG TPA: hypothetical protein VJ734_05610 [Nitrosospira sp.]|nr:hypothetical protein [Nitrosospira sp.]
MKNKLSPLFSCHPLVGTFYGMNFAVMPGLSWEHGFKLLDDSDVGGDTIAAPV